MTIGPKHMYDCPCGKQHKSRDTVRRHKAKIGTNVRSDTPANPGTGTIVKIDLKEEFNQMTEKIQPKKQEQTGDAKYECASCGTKFNERLKYCPGCGVELE